ncbi:MAG TPA: metallopeptidase family protein [Rhizomicrobium sp.]|nr:metallopeptidase family protein [Rhizomicrobium sp.]
MPLPGHEPSLDDLQAMAEEAFAGLPEEFRELTGDIVFMVQDFPDSEMRAGLKLKTGYELLGLFHGSPLAAREANRGRPDPTMIFLFRRPILNYWRSEGGTLMEIVRHVLIHEIGHHFGLSDADMEAIEAED